MRSTQDQGNNGDATVTFYIQLPDGQFINQSFHSIQEARVYCVQHRIHGYQILDEYQVQQMREEAQPSRDRSHYSVIKRPYPVGSARVPVAHPRVSSHNPSPYRPINPRFKPHKSHLGRRKKK